MAIANPLLSFVVRGLQAVFGIVVLGISVSLVRGHHWGSLPATLGFSAFVGGITILGAALGVAGIFLGFLDGTIAIVVDAVIALINLACGVEISSELRGYNCDIQADMPTFEASDIFCGGMNSRSGNNTRSSSNGGVDYTAFIMTTSGCKDATTINHTATMLYGIDVLLGLQMERYYLPQRSSYCPFQP
ncbi:MARVEL domain containing protein [Pyrenophora tritici-repentis]|nr:MARVEL domain containing protein [Pyrenophora tritici-repentis]